MDADWNVVGRLVTLFHDGCIYVSCLGACREPGGHCDGAGAAESGGRSFEALQACAEGRCWDLKGQPVAVVPQGAVLLPHLKKVQPLWSKRPAEPPRYTVYTREEVQTMRRRQEVIGTGIAALCGAVIGGMVGGVPGAVVGGLVGAGLAFAVFHLLGKMR